MDPFFKYFWIIAAAVMAINVVIWRRRLSVIADRGTITRSEADRFVMWGSAWLVGGPLLLGAIEIAAGWSSPFCAGVLMFDTAPRALCSVLSLVGWAALLWWIWLGGGADFLARVGPALGQRPVYDKRYSRTMVRGVVTLFVVLCGVGGAISWRMMPESSQLACPISTTAG
jgi:hypothetical protein